MYNDYLEVDTFEVIIGVNRGGERQNTSRKEEFFIFRSECWQLRKSDSLRDRCGGWWGGEQLLNPFSPTYFT